LIEIEQLDSVAIVRFDRGEKLNAFNQALIKELTETAHRFEFDDTIKAIILTGAPNVFSAGMDLGDDKYALLRTFGQDTQMAGNHPQESQRLKVTNPLRWMIDRALNPV